VLRDAIAATLEPSDISVTVAPNLHSSNSEPDTAAFLFPHFGPAELGYAGGQCIPRLADCMQELECHRSLFDVAGTCRAPEPGDRGCEGL